jgi:D-glycero-D-manno-heptose 1,7-bisphosphate phosphatase
VQRRFVLIDRDGTINVEKHYLSDPDQVELIPGSGRALKKLQEAGFGICIITNQSGIGRGYFDSKQLDLIHIRLRDLVHKFGVRIDGIYYCPHTPDDGCGCRKPLPELANRASIEHGFLLCDAWMIGDNHADMKLGRAVGARCVLVRTGYGKRIEGAVTADFVVDDLAAGAELVLKHTNASIGETREP